MFGKRPHRIFAGKNTEIAGIKLEKDMHRSALLAFLLRFSGCFPNVCLDSIQFLYQLKHEKYRAYQFISHATDSRVSTQNV